MDGEGGNREVIGKVEDEIRCAAWIKCCESAFGRVEKGR